ncbi:MAG: response regulator [Gammaproteobacteria bacterium]|nr:response regulator [Gammaproteobacteria bacterium]
MKVDTGLQLTGVRVMLVEDEGAISLLLETLLESLGCRVVGPASSLSQADKLAAEAEIDVALLDVNVGGERIYPVAEHLAARRVPIVFSTGYGTDGLDRRWHSTPVLVKPFSARQLETALRRVLKGS